MRPQKRSFSFEVAPSNGLDFIPSINACVESLKVLDAIKKNQHGSHYAYMLYDFAKIFPGKRVNIRTTDPLNPTELIPLELDRPSYGKHYSQSSVLSTIMTQVSRYAKSRDPVVKQQWRVIKSNLQKIFRERFFKSGRLPTLTNEILAKHVNPVIRKLDVSGAVFKDLDITLAPLSETYTIHFFLKDITKVVMSKTLDADKCGQGISAWSKTLNAVYCPIFRAIEECFTSSLKERVIYDNGVSETDFDGLVSECYDSDAKIFTNDFKEYDSRQDADTQFLEDVVLELIVEPYVTRLYREMRLGAKQKSSHASLFNTCLKNSGEASTLFTNTILNMFYVALTTEVKGLRLEGYKGDDSFINASEIVLVNKLFGLSKDVHLLMVSDIDFPLHGEFVSYYLSELGLTPDLPKILAKFFSKDYSSSRRALDSWEVERLGVRGLPYYQQVKISLRDKLKFMNYKKYLHLRKVYQDLYGVSASSFEMLMSTYKYFCEVDSASADDFQFFSAVALGDASYERDDLTESDKNRKRVKQHFGNTEITL